MAFAWEINGPTFIELTDSPRAMLEELCFRIGSNVKEKVYGEMDIRDFLGRDLGCGRARLHAISRWLTIAARRPDKPRICLGHCRFWLPFAFIPKPLRL
jgi:hypothetical protein